MSSGYIFLRGVSVNDIVNCKITTAVEDILRFKQLYSFNIMKKGLESINCDVSNPVFKENQSKGYPELYVTTNNLTIGMKEVRIPCVWCRLDINWRGKEHDQVTGILASISPVNINGQWKYPIKAFACCDSCHYAYLMTDFTYQRDERIELLKINYTRRTGRELKPSPNWLLLVDNGGSLNRKQFFSQKYNYIPSGNIIMHGCREIYRVERC